jgi:hypothetical protein
MDKEQAIISVKGIFFPIICRENIQIPVTFAVAGIFLWRRVS